MSVFISVATAMPRSLLLEVSTELNHLEVQCGGGRLSNICFCIYLYIMNVHTSIMEFIFTCIS